MSRTPTSGCSIKRRAFARKRSAGSARTARVKQRPVWSNTVSAGVQSYQGISEVIVDICQAPWFIVRSIA